MNVSKKGYTLLSPWRSQLNVALTVVKVTWGGGKNKREASDAFVLCVCTIIIIGISC